MLEPKGAQQPQKADRLPDRRRNPCRRNGIFSGGLRAKGRSRHLIARTTAGTLVCRKAVVEAKPVPHVVINGV